ncbi:hypothetical protein F4859DRAFT_474091 [Xylaria cf. heliscus]|nr:hypothetical protein F4859DRAFT_474091 [Xylaria cf. heliscus]
MAIRSVERPASPHDAGPAKTCSYMPPELSPNIIDPDGDLSLKVGETKCIYMSRGAAPSDDDPNHEHEHEVPVIYVVCSRTLSRASPVWKKLLYGGFAESKPSCASSASDWVVELPDDNPKAMATILNIIHSRFTSIPRITDLINLEDFYQLTVLTDKYDLTAILRPWAPVWMRSAKEKHESWGRNNTGPVTSDLERLLWIAWEMGDINLFKNVSRDLVLNCSVDANGDLQNNTGEEVVPLFGSTLEPSGQHDTLKSARLNIIKNALAIYDDAIAKLLKQDQPGKQEKVRCKRKDGIWECEAGLLGTMIKSLAESGYWPLPVANDVRVNIIDLLDILKTIRINSPLHPECNGVSRRDRRFSKLESVSGLASSSADARMAKQAAKSGV